MRHTYAINVLKAGENMPNVSWLLGHSSIQITVDTYSHFLHSKERLMRWRGLGEKNKALKKGFWRQNVETIGTKIRFYERKLLKIIGAPGGI
jgi:hypothetical protein